MVTDERRIVIQAHKLRTEATQAAVVHGAQVRRTEGKLQRYLIASVVLAFAIVAGILIGGFIADLISGSR